MGANLCRPFYFKARKMKYVKIRFPTTNENLEAMQIYEDVFKECKDKGMMTTEELQVYLKRYKVFPVEQEESLCYGTVQFSLWPSFYFPLPSLPRSKR